MTYMYMCMSVCILNFLKNDPLYNWESNEGLLLSTPQTQSVEEETDQLQCCGEHAADLVVLPPLCQLMEV